MISSQRGQGTKTCPLFFGNKRWRPEITEMIPDVRKDEQFLKVLAEIGTLIYRDFETNSKKDINQKSSRLPEGQPNTVTESNPCPLDKKKDEVA